MKIYLRPAPIAAISFDLDDTLYDNRPIIRRAQGALDDYLSARFSAANHWTYGDWLRLKATVISANPSLEHDVTAARAATLTMALTQWGVANVAAEVASAMAVFMHHRSDFRVSTAVIELLQQLSQHYPLVGITNGNVDYRAIGLEPVLSFVLHPSHTLAKKPAADMFNEACRRLNIHRSQLLHVGDHPQSDVEGARLAQCQSVWLSPAFGGKQRAAPSLLPQLQIADLMDLAQLLP
ncbi:HAD-IA family hydrolase [Shewanella sp. NIFS-20-20]|uniref:HAD-IA family hydrolase n=1 Tax=Shewanella sp. NIFS-20-20 TaxID=2853806 RepID=UPI001C4656A7|nr:HAD-IA family hydrolase [Shewanella sp. NIFS-20-20]MBV7317261.1 HAD-IA family hydrolase [Shewanella sp. NIFS-20-20]